MCGIVGYYNYKNNKSENINLLNKMLRKIIHRGPDAQGVYCDEQIYMGMRRLSIIDVSESGNQPFYSEDDNIIVIGNGEIYNYIELKEDLLAHGHKFISNSDIEIIVHLYEEFGENVFSYLNGMFAVAIWDKHLNKLLLGRDRVGEKPLFYYNDEERLIFSSEIKSILEYDKYKKDINLEAFNLLLTFNYVPGALTIFKDIYSIPKGSYLVVTKNGLKVNKYWDFPIEIEKYTFKSENTICSELYDLLMDAVKIRLRSDVPIGAFLSGGVDSSAVVSLMSNLVDYKIDTFSIGFNDKRYDELPFAKIVSDIFATNHHTNIVDENTFLYLLPRIIYLNDNPHGDVSFLPTYKVSELAHKYVKVVMTGDGSDEIFAGYDKYFSYLNKFGEEFNVATYINDISVFSYELKRNLFNNFSDFDTDVYLPAKNILERANDSDVLTKMLLIDQNLLLQGNNLVKPDRMGMGNSIEARMPFLDYRVIEYAARIPSNLKINNGETKYILKKTFEKILPHKILYTPKRMFTVPIGEWFKGSMKSNLIDILLSDKSIERGFLNKKVLNNIIREHIEGKANYTRQLRLLLVVELWFRYFIDNENLENILN